MPIYEYQCEHCEHKIEAIHKISDAPLIQCPECKQETLRKLMSAAAFKLTGTGWYETDFKDKKPKNKENKNKEDSKSTNNKDSGKTGKSETIETKTKDKGDTGKSSKRFESKASNTKQKERKPKNSD